MISRMKLIIILAVAVAVTAAGGFAAYDFWQRQQSTQTGIVLYGNIDIREADLAFNIAGRVDSMLVEEGTEVESGQLLATLEDDIYQAEAEAAKARGGAQRAVLDRLLAGSRPEEIRAARANVLAIEANLEDARSNLRRTEKLATKDFATQQTLDENKARVQGLEAQLKSAEQDLSLAIQGPRDEDIAEARAQVRADDADLLLAQRRLGYTKLYAKDHGVVTTRIMEPGSVVQANTPVYTIAISDPVWVRTYVSEPDLGRIHPGMTAKVLTDSAPDKPYEGWIGFISPVAEFTPKSVETREVRTSLVYRLRVYVKNPDNGLRQGMPVTVRLETESDQSEAEKSASE
jgi:membrane fusion protein YbhG